MTPACGSVNELYPKPETIGAWEEAVAAGNRGQKDAAEHRRIDELNMECQRNSRIGHNWFCHEAEARLKSRPLLSLRNERNRRSTDSYPQLNLNACSFIEFHICCDV